MRNATWKCGSCGWTVRAPGYAWHELDSRGRGTRRCNACGGVMRVLLVRKSLRVPKPKPAHLTIAMWKRAR